MFTIVPERITASGKNILPKIGRMAARVLYGVLLTALSLLLVFSSAILIGSAVSRNQVPGLFGIRPLVVLSGSMEPHMRYGDLQLIRNVDPGTLREGDIVTYRSTGDLLISHRIAGISRVDGKIYFDTKGDANNVVDAAPVGVGQIIGKSFLVVPYAGYLSIFADTLQGRLILIMAPLLPAILVLEGAHFFKKTGPKLPLLKISKQER